MEWLDEWLVWGWIALGVAAAVRWPLFALSAVVATQVWRHAAPEDQPGMVALTLACGFLAEALRWRRRHLRAGGGRR